MVSKKLAIGIDLGGTNIKAGVVDARGRIVGKRISIPTEATKDARTVIRNIVRAAEMARRVSGSSWNRISAVGLGAPGVFDGPDGLMSLSPNIRSLDGAPVARLLREAIGREGVLIVEENDANVAAYAELWIGAGLKYGVRNLALMTLGTGVGGGIVLNGEIWRGAWGTAAEIGHTNLFPDGALCGCGNHGCLEAYCSATALVRRFHEAVARGEKTSMPAGTQVEAKDISDAARKGDKLCKRLLDETGRWLGISAMNLLHLLNVEMIVFAGGMTAAGRTLLDPIRREARKRTMKLPMRGVKILFSSLGNDAGLIGAAGWAMRMAERGAE